MTDFLSDYKAEIKDRLEIQLPRAVAKLQVIARALLPHLPPSTSSIQIDYNGCGDDGEIVEVSILPLRTVEQGPQKIWEYSFAGPNGIQKGETYQPTIEVNHTELPESLSVTFEGDENATEFTAESLQQMIEDLAFEILYNRHPGWEISDGEADGGSGTLSIDFPSLNVSLEHSAKYIATEDYHDEWSAQV